MKNLCLNQIKNKAVSELKTDCHRWKVLFLLCAFLAVSISGCSSIENYFIQVFGKVTDEEYQCYIELKDAKEPEQQNPYTAAETDEDSAVHITFAKNEYLEISYYLDAELSQLIDTQSCYLKPGACIYIAEPKSIHPSNYWYSFDHFCVFAYDDNGNKSEELFWLEENSCLLLRIPEDYKGKGVSVEPRGKYGMRPLNLTDYYTDNYDQVMELSGTWIVNGQEVTDKLINVSSAESLLIDYQYNPEQYVFVSSEPASFYHENGLVRFETVSADSDIENYSIELRQAKGVFFFDPAQYPVEHGKVIFEYKGAEITEGCNIPDGDEIEYKAVPDPAYQHPSETGKIIVNASDLEKMDNEIRKIIQFYADKTVEVDLPQLIGGNITYMANGKEIVGDTCQVSSGTTITIDFFPWNGWKCKYEDGQEYKVTDANRQSVVIQEESIQNIFVEDEDHKPELNVVLEKSVEDVIFHLAASGIEEADPLTYAEGEKDTFLPDWWWGQSDRIVFRDKVGTDKPIQLKATDDALLNGYALRLELVFEDTEGNKEEDVRYIKKLPNTEVIEIYSTQESSTSNNVYEKITIIVSRVKVTAYQVRKMDHAAVEVAYEDVTTPCLLKVGDVLEPDRKVRITVIPDEGYRLIDSEEESGCYSDTMKYSKWEKDWETIFEKHPAAKIWHVTLDTTDDYGECRYKLDGKEVSGTVEVYEGQTVKLEYKLTNPEYQVTGKYDTEGIFGGKRYVYKIVISEELNNQIIKRSDYIEIKQKEK